MLTTINVESVKSKIVGESGPFLAIPLTAPKVLEGEVGSKLVSDNSRVVVDVVTVEGKSSTTSLDWDTSVD